MAHPSPRLIAITDVAQFGGERTLRAFERLCHAAAPRTVCIQLRWDAAPLQLLQLGLRLAAICESSEQLLSVNERLDVALVLGVNAVHLKAVSLGVDEVRKLWARRGRDVWISQAWHPDDEMRPGGVDALVVSPVAAPRKGRGPLGTAGLRAACGGVLTPVYALGGVDAANAPEFLGAGATGVAAIGACYGDPALLLGALGIERGN